MTNPSNPGKKRVICQCRHFLARRVDGYPLNGRTFLFGAGSSAAAIRGNGNTGLLLFRSWRPHPALTAWGDKDLYPLRRIKGRETLFRNR